VPYAVTAQVKVEMQAKGGTKQEADFGRLVRMLKDAGYRGSVTLEYEADEPPLTGVPRYLERLRPLLGAAERRRVGTKDPSPSGSRPRCSVIPRT